MGAAAAVGIYSHFRTQRFHNKAGPICLGTRLRPHAGVGSERVSRHQYLGQCLPDGYPQCGSGRNSHRAHRTVWPVALPPSSGDHGKRLHGNFKTAVRDAGQLAEAWLYHRDGRFRQRLFLAEYAHGNANRRTEAGYEVHPDGDYQAGCPGHPALHRKPGPLDETECGCRGGGDPGAVGAAAERRV